MKIIILIKEEKRQILLTMMIITKINNLLVRTLVLAPKDFVLCHFPLRSCLLALLFSNIR